MERRNLYSQGPNRYNLEELPLYRDDIPEGSIVLPSEIFEQYDDELNAYVQIVQLPDGTIVKKATVWQG